jgi:hypothetical protein
MKAKKGSINASPSLVAAEVEVEQRTKETKTSHLEKASEGRKERVCMHAFINTEMRKKKEMRE